MYYLYFYSQHYQHYHIYNKYRGEIERNQSVYQRFLYVVKEVIYKILEFRNTSKEKLKNNIKLFNKKNEF